MSRLARASSSLRLNLFESEDPWVWGLSRSQTGPLVASPPAAWEQARLFLKTFAPLGSRLTYASDQLEPLVSLLMLNLTLSRARFHLQLALD